MKKRQFSLLLCVLLSCCLTRDSALAYTDVPLEHWAAADIAKAEEYGLMKGMGDNIFGLGSKLDRAAFVTILGRMFSWESVSPDTPSYSDCSPSAWYYSAVEAAHAEGVTDETAKFRPSDPITREEMAVMLVRALGYQNLVDTAAVLTSPFADGAGNGYYTLAYDLGLTTGIRMADGTLRFLPSATATREEAAAMLVRVWERYSSKIDWLHGFYAFSSYSQISLTDQMDAVSVGWARISVDPETGPWLNSTSEGDNEWVKPQDSALVAGYLRANSTPCNLNVYASVWDTVTLPDGTVSNAAAEILRSEESRNQTIAAIVAASSDFSGITIDFEGMKNSLKDEFTSFMTSLRADLPSDKALYVCVQPDTWFDGFDYRALGEICDKVILMAHDYQWSSIPDYYVGTKNTDCPVTPFPEIYKALRSITDENTGVADRSKIALAISINSTGFQVDSNGLLLSTTFYNPSISTIITRLRQPDTQMYYSDYYRNPYIYYTTEDGSHYKVWYEDARSVKDKLDLARMFGINSVSLWRLGNIPAYNDVSLYYNVWEAVLNQRS